MSLRAVFGGFLAGAVARYRFSGGQENAAFAATVSPEDPEKGAPRKDVADEAQVDEKDAAWLRWNVAPEVQQELIREGKSVGEYEKKFLRNMEGRKGSAVKAVIVGGSYAGAKMAFLLDSVMDVTMVDEKNFFEMTPDIVPIVCNKWDEENSPLACRKSMYLHRFYLKRANILTGRVNEVSETNVTLDDGRVLEYDMLFLAHGAKKTFPFKTRQRTITARIAELKQVSDALQKAEKVAVVGGGPMGSLMASEFAAKNPTKSVSLFHSGGQAMESYPTEMMLNVNGSLTQIPNLEFHRGTRVTKVVPKDSEELVSGPWWWKTKTIVPKKYDLEMEELEFTGSQEKRSMVYLAVCGPDKVKDKRKVVANKTLEGFDYVLNCTGEIPEPIKGKFLEPHTDLDGRYRVSRLMMLLGRPNVMAIGSCNNLPYHKVYGLSDMQVRLAFKMMYTFTIQTGKTYEGATEGLRHDWCLSPRMAIRLGDNTAIANTPWGGVATGMAGWKEYVSEQSHLMKEFREPKFYKAADAKRVAANYEVYVDRQVTEVTDFD